MPKIQEKIIGDIHSIIEIAEAKQGSNIFLDIKTVMFDTNQNLNGCTYSKEFIQEIADNQDKYISLPLVVDNNMLLAKKYDKLTHLQNKTDGTFGTTQIGSFIKFETAEANGVTQLIGTARVPKRHVKTCAAFIELHSTGDLKFSYEIMVATFTTVSNIKYIDVSEDNYLIGMAVVSSPACPAATALLVASIEELNGLKEGVLEVPRVKYATAEEAFAQTTIYVETAELDLNQIRRKFYSKFKEHCKANQDLGEHWNYDFVHQYPTYVIATNYDSGDYYKISFSILEDDVEITAMVKVTAQWVEADVVEMAEQKKKQEEELMTIAELEAEIIVKDALIAEKDVAITSKDVEIASLNEKIVAVGQELASATVSIAELEPFKVTVEQAQAEKAQAELAEKKTALKAKAEKVLTAEEVTEIAEAIEALDENKVNAVLAAKYVEIAEKSKTEKVKKTETFTASVGVTDSIVIAGESKYFTK